MTLEKLQVLINIYNNFLKITTKGEDSFIMVDNLRSLQKFIMQENKELSEKMEEQNNGTE